MVARRWRGVVLFAVVLACAALSPAMAAQKASAKPPPKARPATPLPWRAEGRPSYTLDAVAYPDSSGWQLTVSVRIPPDAVKFVADEDTAHAAQARLRLQLKLSNQYGAKLHESKQEFTMEAKDSTASFGQVVVTRFPVKPGRVQLWAKLQDLKSRKRGIAYIGRKVNEEAQVEGGIDVPEEEAGLRVGNPEFLWITPAGGLDEMLPNPERLFGLFATTLHARIHGEAPDDSLPWRWRARVVRAGQTVAEQRDSTTAPSRALDAIAGLDLSTLPAGGYDLEVQAWRVGGGAPVLRRGHFSIAWQLGAWRRSPRDVEDDVHLLLSEQEEDKFADLEPGEQEDYMEQFWKRRDQTTGTAANEWKATFEERVAFANEHFGYKGMEKGMFTDMGRVYVRYGPPSDIQKEVIPAGDETLVQVVQQIAATEDIPIGNLKVDAFGGDQRPYEIWTYENVVPIPIEVDPERVSDLRRREKVLFLFVDDQGYGHFTLRYSTE